MKPGTLALGGERFSEKDRDRDDGRVDDGSLVGSGVVCKKLKAVVDKDSDAGVGEERGHVGRSWTRQ